MPENTRYAPIDWIFALAITYAVIAWTMACFAIGILIGNGGPE